MGEVKWYKSPLKAIGYWGIWWHQRRFFGKDSSWRDTHTVCYFDFDKIFSYDFPYAHWQNLYGVCGAKEITVYRCRGDLYGKATDGLDEQDLRAMEKAATQMLGEFYDVGQLLDIAINQVLGFPHRRKGKWFDFGKKLKVCSVGVRVIYEAVLQDILGRPAAGIKFLFRNLNPERWTQEQCREYRGTDVEMTSPAHFANSNFFGHEFKRVVRVKNGQFIFGE